MEAAPFFDSIADGPEGGRAYWCHAEDGVRLRVGHWPAAGDARGTVLLFTGRTEFIEKYGCTARDFAARGHGTLAIDWRGQGLADRVARDPMLGHVGSFADYQLDAAAMLDVAHALDLPRPWHLLGHSMGGCIGLRAAMNGLPVASCAFSAPMWGIALSAALRPLAWVLSAAARKVGLGHLYAPGTTGRDSYVLREPFGTNALTRDAAMHAHMVAQLMAHPELALGAPSLRWLNEALHECRTLSRLPSPDLPCLTLLGSNEEIVEVAPIEARIARWPGAVLDVVDGGRHELLMDTPATRAHVADRLAAHWALA